MIIVSIPEHVSSSVSTLRGSSLVPESQGMMWHLNRQMCQRF